ncbi:MAG: hypothetical protein B6D41_09915 [Chloroflexi bacterium UTCFX4]|nr:MAG: hypothetical protein B6D41_09915 [Chloroflexi bacterium UTCFX4]
MTATDQPVARLTNYAGFYSPRVWLKDDTGPILESFASTMTVFPNDPRPILLVQVPREYLTPEARAREQIRQIGWLVRIPLWVSFAVLVIGGLFWLQNHRRWRKNLSSKESPKA